MFSVPHSYRPIPHFVWAGAVVLSLCGCGGQADSTRLFRVATDEPEPFAGSRTLEVLADPTVAESVCRWVTVAAQPEEATPEGREACESQLDRCRQAGEQIAGGAESVLPALGLLGSDAADLGLSEDCRIAPGQLDGCLAELVLFVEPAASSVTCEQPNPVLPALDFATLAGLSTCLQVVGTCPELLGVLQAGMSP